VPRSRRSSDKSRDRDREYRDRDRGSRDRGSWDRGSRDRASRDRDLGFRDRGAAAAGWRNDRGGDETCGGGPSSGSSYPP
jgi:hypothetical protein